MSRNSSRLTPRPSARSASTSSSTVAALAALGLAGAACEPGDPCEQSGNICTFAGTGDKAFNGDGLERKATAFYWPLDLDFAADGTGYLLDWQNHRVRRLLRDGRIDTVMGSDLPGDGPVDQSDTKPEGAPGLTVELNHPTDVHFAPDGGVLVAAWHNHKIRRLDPATGRVTVLVGAGPGKIGDGGPAKAALLSQPKSVTVDAAGNMFITDSRNQRIRKVDAATGVIRTVAGSGLLGDAGDGGGPMLASFHMQEDNDNPEPGGNIALDGAGRLYVADTFNHRVRQIDLATGMVTTVAGNGQPGHQGDGGPAITASLSLPRDVEMGPDGRLYIADTDNHRIRAVDLTTGVITTVAGDGQGRFGGDGGPATAASLLRPFGVTFDASGNLYVADTFNNRIRRIAR